MAAHVTPATAVRCDVTVVVLSLPQVAKKPVKKVAKKPIKKVVKKAGFKGPAAAQPGSNPVELAGKFLSTENWGVQALQLLGDGTVPVPVLAGVGVWVLILLRFVIFYGSFGVE